MSFTRITRKTRETHPFDLITDGSESLAHNLSSEGGTLKIHVTARQLPECVTHNTAHWIPHKMRRVGPPGPYAVRRQPTICASGGLRSDGLEQILYVMSSACNNLLSFCSCSWACVCVRLLLLLVAVATAPTYGVLELWLCNWLSLLLLSLFLLAVAVAVVAVAAGAG